MAYSKIQIASQRPGVRSVAVDDPDSEGAYQGFRESRKRPGGFENDLLAIRRPVGRAPLIEDRIAGLETVRLARRLDHPDLVFFLLVPSLIAGECDLPS